MEPTTAAPVADPTDTTALSKALARTYGGPELDRDPWERVQEYERVMAYVAEHTQMGSAAVSTALDLPRGRIRPWMESGAKPDPVRAIDAATEHGWLSLQYGEPPFSGLTILVSWVFSGGSIDQTWWRPWFAVTEDAEPSLECAFEMLGIDHEVNDREGRGVEWRPTTSASVLGRLLHVLGAPVGSKGPDTDIALPPWLDTAPRETQLRFARTYIQNRGTPRTDRSNTPVAFREERPAAYLRELRSFLRELVGDENIRGESENIRLTRAAAGVLDQPPLDVDRVVLD